MSRIDDKLCEFFDKLPSKAPQIRKIVSSPLYTWRLKNLREFTQVYAPKIREYTDKYLSGEIDQRDYLKEMKQLRHLLGLYRDAIIIEKTVKNRGRSLVS